MKGSLERLIEKAKVAKMVLEKIDRNCFGMTIVELGEAIMEAERDYRRTYCQYPNDRRKNPR